MLKHRLASAGLLSFSLIAALAAQTPPQPPKPSAEQQKLDYFVGTWNLESEMKASPFGPAGKATGTDRVESLGGFSVVFHSDAKTPSGNVKSVGIIGHDAAAKHYIYSGAGSDGGNVSATGTVTGNTWTWQVDIKMGGQASKGRFTVMTASPTSYSFKFEMANEKGVYSVVEEGKATKAK